MAQDLGLAWPLPVLFAIMVLARLLTELLSNVAAALAAAFGPSASFLIPYGYQTHLMVMSPGNDRLSDFLKLGAVVPLAYSVAALMALWALSSGLRYRG